MIRIRLNSDREFARRPGDVEHAKVVDPRIGYRFKPTILNMHESHPLAACKHCPFKRGWRAKVEPVRLRQINARRPLRPSANCQALACWAVAMFGSGILPVSFFCKSRICFRRRTLRIRCRPNLALSPFLCDIVPSGGKYQRLPVRWPLGTRVDIPGRSPKQGGCR